MLLYLRKSWLMFSHETPECVQYETQGPFTLMEKVGTVMT